MKNLALILTLLFVFSTNAQVDFEKHSSLLLDAHRAKEKKEYQLALKLYEQAFSINGANSILEYLNAAYCAAQQNDSDTCEKWLIASIVEENASLESLDMYIENEVYAQCFEKIAGQYDEFQTQYYRAIKHPHVYHKIDQLLQRDQFVREINDYINGISKKEQEIAFDSLIVAQSKNDKEAIAKYKAILFPKVSDEQKAYQLKAMKQVDSINVKELIKITKVYGWQKEAWLLLWHQRGTYGKDNWVWNYFKPLINKEIEQKKLPKSFWAMFEDFKATQERGVSIYGYRPGKVDEKSVNKNRKAIGLPILTKAEIVERNNNPYGGRVF